MNTNVQGPEYIVGIDVGESGIGKVAIEVVPGTLTPLRILNAHVTIIDGGKDPSTGKSPKSRKAVSGVARRTRRLHKRKRNRLKALKNYLDDHQMGLHGFDAENVTYEPWAYRFELTQKFVEDAELRSRMLHVAFMHIARHRGWRNPWWKLPKLQQESKEPSKEFNELAEHVSKILEVPRDSLTTIGQMGALASRSTVSMRPRHGSKTSLVATKNEVPVFNTKIMQSDVLAEVELICQMQRVPADQMLELIELIFRAEAPTVPQELVGKDPFDKQPRAPRASLEFQEFRIRSTVANLRKRSTGARLEERELEIIIDKLMNQEDVVPPSWDEVADWIGMSGANLNFSGDADVVSNNAPINKTTATLLLKKKDLKQVVEWWQDANDEQRSQFALFLSDSSKSSDTSLTEELFGNLSEEELIKLDSIDFDKGRANYSLGTLKKLNKIMREKTCDLSDALRIAFGVEPGWKPPAPSFQDKVDHPTVDRVMTDVGRWMQALYGKYGLPKRVAVEHVRSAFMGPEAKLEYQREIQSNQNRRAKLREQLRTEFHIDKPLDRDITKLEAITMQEGKCLYCGNAISFSQGVELDHIVARSRGGSNKRENLVAICRSCNARKGNFPFGLWAESFANNSEITVANARKRLKEWRRPRDMSVGSFNKLKRNISLRLARKSNDEPIDERAMASTAFAAREIAVRIESFMNSKDPYDPVTGEVQDFKVNVYRGAITSTARKLSGIDKRILLRGFTAKSRFDRRHHAIDAAVVSLIQNTVAKSIAEYSELCAVLRMTPRDQKNYQELRAQVDSYKPSDSGEEYLFAKWKSNSLKLSELISEAIDEDRIVVQRPLRLSPKVGKLHDDGVEALIRKSTEESFDASEVQRIVDNDVYLAAIGIVDKKGCLPELSERQVSHVSLNSPGIIELYPGTKDPTPKLAVRGGCVAIGGSVHHSRIYVVKDSKGKLTYYQLRVFAGEFGNIGFLKNGVDILTEPLPEWSQAIRCCHPTLRASLREGRAKFLGWVALGDEIELSGDAMKIVPVIPSCNVIPVDVQERRWVVTGADHLGRVSIVPAYLAKEGLDNINREGAMDKDKEKNLADILNRKIIAVNVLFSQDLTILRRTALGAPRWKENGGLPVSWNTVQRRTEVFNDAEVESA